MHNKLSREELESHCHRWQSRSVGRCPPKREVNLSSPQSEVSLQKQGEAGRNAGAC